MEKIGKPAVFPGGYGRIGEIPHGRVWPDWGLESRNDDGRNHLKITSSVKPFILDI